MFKWFVDLFFDVEEEIIEEHPEKPSSNQNTKSIKPVVKEVDNTFESVTKPKPEVVEIFKEEKKSIFIDDVVQKRVDIPVLNKVTEINKKDYTFTPIISPIFGIDDKYQPRKASQDEVRPLMPNTSALGTVISPIYGSAINEHKPIIFKGQLTDEDIIDISLAEMLSDQFTGTIDKVESSAWENDIDPIDDHDLSQVNNKEFTSEIETHGNVAEYITSNDDESDLLVEEKRFEIEKQPSLFDYME